MYAFFDTSFTLKDYQLTAVLIVKVLIRLLCLQKKCQFWCKYSSSFTCYCGQYITIVVVQLILPDVYICNAFLFSFASQCRPKGCIVSTMALYMFTHLRKGNYNLKCDYIIKVHISLTCILQNYALFVVTLRVCLVNGPGVFMHNKS